MPDFLFSAVPVINFQCFHFFYRPYRTYLIGFLLARWLDLRASFCCGSPDFQQNFLAFSIWPRFGIVFPRSADWPVSLVS